MNFGSALADDVARFTPGLSSLFYARTIYNRAIIDNLRRAIDPDYAKHFTRQRDKLKDLHGQEFFWEPGQNAPSRGPDMGAMFR